MSHLCNRCVHEFLILAHTWFALGLPSKTGCDRLWGFRTARPLVLEDAAARQVCKMRRRGGPARRWWPATRWRSATEHRQGRGSRSSPLPAVRRSRRRMTMMTMMTGWRSAPASAPRPISVPRQPPRALLAVQPFLRRGRQCPCPRRGHPPILLSSLPMRKRQRSWRRKPRPFPRKSPLSLRVHRQGPLSGRLLEGTWRRGLSLPSCCHPRVHSGPSYDLGLDP
jgi:hypothetical protein